jgi:hypothetical protein
LWEAVRGHLLKINRGGFRFIGLAVIRFLMIWMKQKLVMVNVFGPKIDFFAHIIWHREYRGGMYVRERTTRLLPTKW